MIFFPFFVPMHPGFPPSADPVFKETYRMPGWVTLLLGISYTTVSLLVWGTGGADILNWFQGLPSEEGPIAFGAWCGVTALEGFLFFGLLRAPFTWTVSNEGVHLRFGIWRNRSYTWTALRQVEVVHLDPWDAGGYGIKYGPHGWTYAFFEGTGIRLDFVDPKKKSVCFAFVDLHLGKQVLELAQKHVAVSDPRNRLLPSASTSRAS
jgi:hypothetical protein